MAYLIHANRWTLKRTYAYVVARRNAASPNIGFISELMRFEEKRLGIKESKGLLPGPEDNQDEPLSAGPTLGVSSLSAVAGEATPERARSQPALTLPPSDGDEA